MKGTVTRLRGHWWFKLFLGIVSYIILPVGFFFGAVTMLFIRIVAIYSAKIFRPEFGLPLSAESGLTTVDHFYTDGEVMHAVVGVHYTDKPILRDTVIKRMSEILQEDKFPELRQQLVRWCGQYFWGPCPDFRLENHVTEWPDVKNVRDVQLAQDTLCRKGFLMASPFWDITLFPNFKDGEGGSAFALRVHHCLTDGLGHVSLLNAIGGLDPTPPLPPQSWPDWALSWIRHILVIFRLYLSQYSLSIAFIEDYNYNSWIKPRAQRSREVVFHESHELELATLKKASKVMGHTVSEVIMAAFSTALREDMEAAGDPVPIQISAIHPMAKINPPHPGTLTNHAYMNTLVLPVAMKERKEQLLHLAKDYRLKRWSAPFTNLPVMIFGMFLQLVKYLPNVGPYTSLAVTSFALSSKPWVLFGGEIKKTSFVFDMSEHVPLVAMFIGYRDKMCLWLKCRKDVMESDERPKRIVETMIREVNEMARAS